MLKWVSSWIWRPNPVDTIMVYCRDPTKPIEDRKEYFYKHMNESVFEQLKRPERKQDLYFISDLLVSSLKNNYADTHTLPTLSSNFMD